MRSHAIGALVFAVALAVNAAQFQFVDGVGVDNQAQGGAMTVDGITLTTVDVRGWGGSEFTLASAGGGHTANVSGSSGTELGVNSAATPPNASNDPKNFDLGEAWMFTLSTSVNLNSIYVRSLDATGAQMTISAPGITPVVITQNGVNHFDNVYIPAGTVITIENSSPTSTAGEYHDFRIGSLTVTPAEDPVPASLGLIMH